MIPKLIHFIWVGDESKSPDNCMRTWRDLNPTWDFRLWGNEDLEQREWVNRRHISEMHGRELNGVADMMRWEILYRNGGVLVDADSICVRPLDDHLLECEAFACWENEIIRPGLIAAGYFGCEPENPFVGQIIKDIAAESTVIDRMAWESVGPQRLTDTYRKYGYSRLRIYPSHYFIPQHFTGVTYEGSDPVYAHQLWGSTRSSYDEIHKQVFNDRKAPVAEPSDGPEEEKQLFHRIWFGDRQIPAAYEEYWTAWQRQHPDCEFITWTDSDIDKLPLCREKLKGFSSHISRADLARYEILHRFGGIYLDCDIMPYQHFSVDDVTRTLTVCNETESRDYCSIGFIATPRGHPIFRDIIDHVLREEIDEERPNVSTGPWLFGAFLKKHPHKRLNTDAFYPYLYDEPLSIVRRRSLDNSLGIHVWGGSWLPAEARKNKAFQLIGKGDIQEPMTILADFEDQWSEDVKILLDTMRTVRTDSVQAAQVLQEDMSIDTADHAVFEFGKVVAWLLDEDRQRMVWQIGAADGMLVDPLRPAMINYDPPSALLEPNPYMFDLLRQGYRNNRNATLLPLAYGVGSTELVLNAINPAKVEQLGLPRWVLGLSSVYDDKNAIGGKTIDQATTRLIQSCVEKITVQAIGFEDLLARVGGRLPDILVVDAEGMDKTIILDILSRGHVPMVIHFEIQCLEADEQEALLAEMRPHYVILQFGNDMTAYRNDMILDYARSIYVENGIPTIFSNGLKLLNGL